MNTDVDINSYYIRPENIDDNFECPYYLEYAVSGGAYGGGDDTWVDIFWEEFLTYEEAVQRCREVKVGVSAIKKTADYKAKIAELRANCANYPSEWDEF